MLDVLGAEGFSWQALNSISREDVSVDDKFLIIIS